MAKAAASVWKGYKLVIQALLIDVPGKKNMLLISSVIQVSVYHGKFSTRLMHVIVFII